MSSVCHFGCETSCIIDKIQFSFSILCSIDIIGTSISDIKKSIRYHSALEEISARKAYIIFRIDIINISSLIYVEHSRIFITVLSLYYYYCIFYPHGEYRTISEVVRYLYVCSSC